MAATARPPAQERKVVSVLVADRVGFTAKAEQLDPEDVRALLEPYRAAAKGALERYGGTMEKFIGDAAFALFGAPLAHEDDPERAVRAAIALREAVAELDAVVRIGITTGEVLVDLDARPLEGQGMAAGDVVNTASRLQAAAPPGGILVDEASWRATQGVIDYRAAEPIHAKGKAQPVPVWEVVAPRARLGVDIAFRGAARLIGRDAELASLREAFERARRDRAVQLLTLVGMPGIGKSRLVYELWSSLEQDPDLSYWRQGRSLPYGDGVSFWALGEMVKGHAGILENDNAAAAAAKLRQAVSRAVGEDADWIESHVRPLVGLGSGVAGAERRGEAFAAWRRFFEALAEERPLVLVFEDIHWADDDLLDFIDDLTEWATDVPLLVVCTARPELLERRAGWGGGKRNAATISLTPLADDEVAELVTALVGEERPELVAHAGGNPLYAEEYARMLAQDGNGHSPALPESVQGIIAARLDTLPLEEKALVQDAAVLGKVFWTGELAHVVGVPSGRLEERLRVLEVKEFVRRERRSSVEGEAAYVFRHALVRDVAYSQIPRARRAERHVRAADWVESLAGDRREDLADVVAHHYLSALELARAAGEDTSELAQRARLALRDAGERAANLNAPAAAAQFFEAALALWPEDAPERADLVYRYGRALHPQGRGVEVLSEAAEALLDLGDREQAAESQAFAAEVLYGQGRHDEALRQLETAAALLEGEPRSRAKTLVLADLARYRMTSDEAESAIAIGTEALRMADALDLDDLRGHILNTIGIARTNLGDPAGIDDLRRAVEIAEELNVSDVIRAYNNLASTYAVLGLLDESFEFALKARHAAERFGWTAVVRRLEINALDMLYVRGRWDEGLARADAFLTEATDPDACILRALMRLGRGDVTGALADSERALESVREIAEPQTLFPVLACRAWVLAESGEPGAEAVFSELLARWGRSPATPASMWLPLVAATTTHIGGAEEVIAVLAATRLKTPWLEAATEFIRGAFQEAAQVYARIGSQPDEAQARLRAAEALASTGRRVEAESELQEALEFFRRVGAARYLRAAEALLAAT
jgi:predicted ATPase/class 3 adenylate cyclase